MTSAESAAPYMPLRVLIVDDEPLICWSLAQTLSDHGDTVIEAGSGAAALRAMSTATDPIDVVLLDYRLPDVDHLNLLSSVRRLLPAGRVIVVTAFLTPEIASEALSLGASRVVSKPLDMCDVPALVHDVARSPQH
jgi:DNA-binding NtrC family response regulator